MIQSADNVRKKLKAATTLATKMPIVTMVFSVPGSSGVMDAIVAPG